MHANSKKENLSKTEEIRGFGGNIHSYSLGRNGYFGRPRQNSM
jgi:hypothetical protein